MKRLLHSTITLLLAAGFMVLLAALLTLPASATPAGATRYVAPGGACGGASPCYATVQAAVDAANDGDEIKIAQGTYTGGADKALDHHRLHLHPSDTGGRQERIPARGICHRRR